MTAINSRCHLEFIPFNFPLPFLIETPCQSLITLMEGGSAGGDYNYLYVPSPLLAHLKMDYASHKLAFSQHISAPPPPPSDLPYMSFLPLPLALWQVFFSFFTPRLCVWAAPLADGMSHRHLIALKFKPTAWFHLSSVWVRLFIIAQKRISAQEM